MPLEQRDIRGKSRSNRETPSRGPAENRWRMASRCSPKREFTTRTRSPVVSASWRSRTDPGVIHRETGHMTPAGQVIASTPLDDRDAEEDHAGVGHGSSGVSDGTPRHVKGIVGLTGGFQNAARSPSMPTALIRGTQPSCSHSLVAANLISRGRVSDRVASISDGSTVRQGAGASVSDSSSSLFLSAPISWRSTGEIGARARPKEVDCDPCACFSASGLGLLLLGGPSNPRA